MQVKMLPIVVLQARLHTGLFFSFWSIIQTPKQAERLLLATSYFYYRLQPVTCLLWLHVFPISEKDYSSSWFATSSNRESAQQLPLPCITLHWWILSSPSTCSKTCSATYKANWQTQGNKTKVFQTISMMTAHRTFCSKPRFQSSLLHLHFLSLSK